ncbi:MAG: DUF916 domain-containing protein [Alphaproteobacteria bacterium]|nr:DUF916 domain-containing protein [Alphaproteobacteria bacterium]
MAENNVNRNHRLKRTLIGLGLFLAAAQPVAAIEYGGFGGRPAYPRPDNPRTESIFVHTLEPGTSKKDGVMVVNNTDQKKSFLVYAADGLVTGNGDFSCRQYSEEKKDVGTWVKMDQSEVTLDAKTQVIINFSINVPKDAGVGEHDGCILIQEKKDPAPGQTGIVLTMRTGLRMALEIPGNVVRQVELTGFTVSKDKGNIILSPAVKNSSNVSIDTEVKVKTKDIFGRVLGDVGGEYPIMRERGMSWNFELKKPFFGGVLFSQTTVRYDDDPKAAVGVSSGKELKRIESKTITHFSFPTWQGLAIELAALAFIGYLGFLWWVARKRKQWISNTWVDYEVQTGEDINGLAERHKVDWKLLAKTNKLKPPYAIRVGEKLKVPQN